MKYSGIAVLRGVRVTPLALPRAGSRYLSLLARPPTRQIIHNTGAGYGVWVSHKVLTSSTIRRPFTAHRALNNEYNTTAGNASVKSQSATKEKNEEDRKYSKKEKEEQSETKENHSEFRDIVRLMLLVRRDWKLLLTAVGLLTISCSIGMTIPKVIGLILDQLKNALAANSVDGQPVSIDKLPPIVFGLSFYEFLGGFALALLVGIAANYGRIILLRVLSERLVARLRATVIKKTIHQDAEFFDTHKVGDLISRLGSDAYVVSRSMTQKVSDGFKALICGSVGIGMMLALSPQLSCLLLVFTPPVILSASVFGKQISTTSRELQEATGHLTKVAEEQLSGIKTVQSFVAEQREINRYNFAIRDIFNIGKKAAVINAKFFSSTSAMGDLSFLTVLGFGSYLVLQNSLTIGDLTAFMMYTEYTGNSIFGLSTFYSEIMQGAGAASRLFELTDRVPSISTTKGVKYKPGNGEIEFKNVSFAYPTRPSNMIFKNLNFKIEAGSNVCIVGPSGRGKSTVALLLEKYYKPSSGEILIDGQNINDLNSKSLRRHIGLVQQEPILMSGTIRDNIVYGLTEMPTKDEIRQVAKQCFCHNFITRFQSSYDTVIGPHGTLLSGGQKQRIAIARALIKKPRILILDEATSALDVESEGAINYTFGQLMKKKEMTIVSIAHRLSTIRRSENVIVLGHDGSVVEMGKFKELWDDPTSELSQLLNEKSTPLQTTNITVTPPPTTMAEKVVEEVVENAEPETVIEDPGSPPMYISTVSEVSAEGHELINEQIEDTIENVMKDVTSERKPLKLQKDENL